MRSLQNLFLFKLREAVVSISNGICPFCFVLIAARLRNEREWECIKNKPRGTVTNELQYSYFRENTYSHILLNIYTSTCKQTQELTTSIQSLFLGISSEDRQWTFDLKFVAQLYVNDRHWFKKWEIGPIKENLLSMFLEFEINSWL